MASQTKSRVPLIVGGGVVLLVVIAASAFFFFTRDTSDPELKLSDTDQGTGKTIEPSSLDGAWKVVPGSGDDATIAGYRVREEFAAGARKVTANGRTNDVSGSLHVAGRAVTEGTFTVDLTTLESDEGRRDDAIRDRGLQTNQFPEGTFTLTEPIELPELADGKTFTATATGDLTLHGVTKPTTIELEGRATGDTFTVTGSAPVAFDDFDIEAPSIGGFVEVSDEGSFEFLVNFERA